MPSSRPCTTIKRTELVHRCAFDQACECADLPSSVRTAIEGRELLALVQVVRGGDPLTMIVDGDWIAMAQEAASHDASLVNDIGLPAAAVLAVIDGWPDGWSEHDWDRHVEHFDDGVLRLQPV